MVTTKLKQLANTLGNGIDSLGELNRIDERLNRAIEMYEAGLYTEAEATRYLREGKAF